MEKFALGALFIAREPFGTDIQENPRNLGQSLIMSEWHNFSFGKIVDLCPLFETRRKMSEKNSINENEMSQNEEIISENTDMTENLADAQEPETHEEGSSPSGDIVKIQAELAEQKDKFIRLYSEFENFRRRTAKEKLEMVQSANEQLIKALLPVADDFDRAEKAFKDKSDKDLEGFLLIYNKFKKTLDQAGVKIMDVQVGSDFDPDLHEAITQIPVSDEKLKGKVVDVVENGYLLIDKVIRYAKVVVGN